MNDTNKNIIIVILMCAPVVGLAWMISSTLPAAPIEPCGQLTGGDENIGPMGMYDVEAINWDEMIYVPVHPKCKGENMIFVGGPVRIKYENGTEIWHWPYTCAIAEMNQTYTLR